SGRRAYMPKGGRTSTKLPGLLAATVKQRCREFGHVIFTPYAVGLVCYDLRSDAKHSITLEIARDTQPAQDAADRELVARYRPGQPRKGLLVQMVDRIHRLQSVAAASRHDLPLPSLSAVAERVTFPFEIWRLVDVRWKEVGYRSLSAYITGLIRYDLLVSGPHSSITADCRSKLQRKLTRQTLAERRKARRRKLLLDHLIEEAEGRPMPEQELERVKARIVKELRRISFSPGSAKMPAQTIAFQREPIRTSSRGASTVKVERSERANVAARIFDAAIPLPRRQRHYRKNRYSAVVESALIDGVTIRHIQVNRTRHRSELRRRVGEHEHRVADSNRSMHHGAVWALLLEHHLALKCCGDEVNQSYGAFSKQIRSEGMESFWDWFNRHRGNPRPV